MFGGGDPFGQLFGQFQRRQMQEMDQMMNSMMDPFGMMNRHSMIGGMLEDAHLRRPVQRDDMALMSPFGGGLFGGMMNQMGNIQAHAMNDPNSHVFTQSTMISFDGRNGGQPRVVETSMRKTGDVRETRHAVRTGQNDGVGDKMTISHSIGDRAHTIEKKRDRGGRIRGNQSFVNIDQDEAEDFDREFRNRANRNLGGQGSRVRHAIEADGSRAGSSHAGRNRSTQPRIKSSGAAAPIVTLPDEGDDEQPTIPTNSRNSGGPVICEITEDDDHYAGGNHKRRKGAFNRIFKANDE